MPTMVDLLQKIWEEQRQAQSHVTQQAQAGIGMDNARLAGEGARFKLDTEQQEQAAEIELARRRYPDLDPLEAMIRMKADDSADDRDVKRRTAEAQIGRADLYEQSIRSQIENRQTDNDRAQDAQEAALQSRMLQDEKLQLIIDNLNKYGRQSAPAPPRGGQPPKPEKYIINDNEWKSARAELNAEKVPNITTAMIRQRAVQKKYGVDIGAYSPEEASGLGFGKTPAPPAASGPINVGGEEEARVICSQRGGTLQRKPDGNFKCVGAR